jgi:hypothetical protein
MNKKAIEFLTEHIIYIIVVAIFFSVMFLFVSRAGSQVTAVEQLYAKQIALIIDKSNPETEINIDISKLYKKADSKSLENIIKIDNNNNKVTVSLVPGKGYSYNFFSSNNIVWNLKKPNLYIKIIKS